MKPAWLNKKISLRDCFELKKILREENLHTVCEEAQCPNVSECFKKKQATFLIMGDTCTRACRFCGVKKGKPSALDQDEPERIARCVKGLNLSYVVITSVTRDDLLDGGAGFFVKTVNRIRQLNPETKIEVLIPDFKAETTALEKLAKANPHIIAHNLETVPRLYPEIRQGASYQTSLTVFRVLKSRCDIPLKSGLMLGLGERKEEVLEVFKDLLSVGCSYLSLGQYLRPTLKHYPVKEYVLPEVFEEYRLKALSLGFKYVKSSPYVRSSYLAEEYIKYLF